MADDVRALAWELQQLVPICHCYECNRILRVLEFCADHSLTPAQMRELAEELGK